MLSVDINVNYMLLTILYELLFAINDCEISPFLLENVALRVGNLQVIKSSAVVSDLCRVV
jgi:hypothetical protein